MLKLFFEITVKGNERHLVQFNEAYELLSDDFSDLEIAEILENKKAGYHVMMHLKTDDHLNSWSNQMDYKKAPKQNKELVFKVILGGSEVYLNSEQEMIDIFYEEGYGISTDEIVEILENKHPMYDVEMLVITK